jgi:very-short-patch-repair endonuclease
LAIEIDGSQHAMPDGIQHDLIREERLKAAGLRIMRFWNLDIDQNLNGVVDAILIEIDPRLVGDVRRT